MKLTCLLLICLTNILLRASAYVFMSRDNFPPPLLLAGLLAFLLISLPNRRPIQLDITVTNQLRCNDGYTLYPGPGKRFCFRVSADCRSWDEAQTTCQMEGGNLIVLDDESLRPFISGLNPYLISAIQCRGLRFAFLGAKIDDTLGARYINGGNIPSDSPLWFPLEKPSPNDCLIAVITGISDNVFLLSQFCSSKSLYVCQHF